jgi:hypothetical protein
MVVKLKCNLILAITDPDSFTDVVVSGNSVFDPFFSHSSVQPPGFDQFSALYNSYVVTGSKITMQPMVQGTQTAVVASYRGVVCTRDTSTAYSAGTDMSEQAYARKQDYSFPGDSGKKLSLRMSTAKVLGLRDVYQPVQGDLQCVAVVTANPTAEWFWHFSMQTLTVGTNVAVAIDTLLEYEVEFFERAGVGTALERLHALKDQREQYLKLKALTPDRSGRVPKAQPEDPLRKYVSSLQPGIVKNVVPEVKAESKEEPGGWSLLRTPRVTVGKT